MSHSSPLLAISPLDGRYAPRLEELRAYSEAGRFITESELRLLGYFNWRKNQLLLGSWPLMASCGRNYKILVEVLFPAVQLKW